MTTLKLKARLSYIDAKLQFITDDEDTVAKLQRHDCGKANNFKLARLPTYNFSVKTGHPASVQDLVGKDVVATVRLKPYRFKSTLAHNLGQTVTGCTLELVDIV